MIYLGIDPGLDGGLAYIRNEGPATMLDLHKTPLIGGKDYDVQDMKLILKEFPASAVFERLKIRSRCQARG